jgi:cell division septation protein DedD
VAPPDVQSTSDAVPPAIQEVFETPEAGLPSPGVDTVQKPVDTAASQTNAASNNAPEKASANAPAETGPRYSIQVRATQDGRTATDLISLLKKQGHPVYAETADLKKRGVWRRIFIGPFPSENDARRYVNTHKLSGAYPDYMIRRVSTFPTPATEQTKQPAKTGPQKR